MANSPKRDDAGARIIVPKDRQFSRGQGCWNCKHWSVEGAVKRWSDQRQGNLTKALNISLDSPEGEDDIRVKNIRHMVDRLDQEIARGSAGTCSGSGKDPHGNPVGDFVVHNYLCGQWSGAQGASIAREGGKADTLPEELQERLDGPKSSPPKQPLIPGGSLVRKGVN